MPIKQLRRLAVLPSIIIIIIFNKFILHKQIEVPWKPEQLNKAQTPCVSPTN